MTAAEQARLADCEERALQVASGVVATAAGRPATCNAGTGSGR